MIFNSYPYIGFLIVAVLAYVGLEKWFPRARQAYLLTLSYFFYAWWRADFLLLLAGSTIINYAFGQVLARRRAASLPTGRYLAAIIIFNLSLLGVFKYAAMAVSTFDVLSGSHLPIPHFFLPLAISFFTFEQISYQVDTAAGRTKNYTFFDYALFVSFFPHLIAGPIIRFNSLYTQFHETRTSEQRAMDIAVGASLFTAGLAKKVLIADNLSPYVNVVFAGAERGPVFMGESWIAAVFFFFQIYFDFSGYSDMALGSAKMFGIRLPVNFNSPYKAANIVDFWRRWHMTLQRFIVDYLYTPVAIALTRWSMGRRLSGWTLFFVSVPVPVTLIFLASGLWHGASWTCVVWGLMHGIYVSINEAWRYLRGKKRKHRKTAAVLIKIASTALTMLAVVIADVMFRATSFTGAGRLYQAMLGLGTGASAPLVSVTPLAIIAIIVAGAFVLFLPNSLELTWRQQPALPPPSGSAPIRELTGWLWQPKRRIAVAMAILAFVSLLSISNLSPFIYFQF